MMTPTDNNDNINTTNTTTTTNNNNEEISLLRTKSYMIILFILGLSISNIDLKGSVPTITKTTIRYDNEVGQPGVGKEGGVDVNVDVDVIVKTTENKTQQQKQQKQQLDIVLLQQALRQKQQLEVNRTNNTTTTTTTTTTKQQQLHSKSKIIIRNKNDTTSTTTTTTTTTTINECNKLSLFEMNSKKWLYGQRISNIGGQYLIDDNKQMNIDSFVDAMMDPNPLNHLTLLTDQTICHRNGRFRKGIIEATTAISTTSATSTISDTTKKFTQATSSKSSYHHYHHHHDPSIMATSWNVSNMELIKEWEFKLIYLSIHSFFHQYARKEYQHRKEKQTILDSCATTTTTTNKQTNSQFSSSSNSSSFDNRLPHNYEYECLDAKYIVTSVPEMGMGASFRLGVMAHILMGIASNRIPIIVSNTKYGPKFLTKSWYLSSCNRYDTQCIFLPITPCTILHSDLQNATIIPEIDARSLRRGGILNSKYNNDTIVIVESRVVPAKFDIFKGIHNTIRRKIYTIAMNLITTWEESIFINDISYQDIQQQQQQQKREVLKMAAKQITIYDPKDENDHYYYGHRHYRIPHAIVMYLLRPNQYAKKRMEQQLKAIIPPKLVSYNNNNVNKRKEPVIGLPIRGSDKCRAESTCLKFDKYMQLANETYWNITTDDNQSIHTNDDTITGSSSRGMLIMTTEDKSLFDQRHKYSSISNNTSSKSSTTTFPLDFIVNHKDTLQGTGRTIEYGINADDIMISSLVALQMQFHSTTIVYGNCCSNFHLLLFDFLREGCGLLDGTKPLQSIKCMQETTNYNICCQWTKTNECIKIRNEFHKQQQQQQQQKHK